MRDKKRYVLFRVEGPRLGVEEAKHLVYEAIFQVLGEAGASLAAPLVKEFKEGEQKGVLKVSVRSLEGVLAAFALKRYWKGQDVAVRSLQTTGVFRQVSNTRNPVREARLQERRQR